MGARQSIAAASILVLAALLPACARSEDRAAAREPVIGGPCEGCEAVFQGLPEQPGWSARIAPRGTPGEPLRIEGRVLRPDGSAAPGTIVYAYHTDSGGVYPRDRRLRGAAARHGALRGWARADEQGRYRFDTVRPGGYPGSEMPQHIHMHVIEPDCCTYYIDDLVFRDDPRLTDKLIERSSRGRGGTGVVTPRSSGEGGWLVRRDIVLGAAIPGHPAPALPR